MNCTKIFAASGKPEKVRISNIGRMKNITATFSNTGELLFAAKKDAAGRYRKPAKADMEMIEKAFKDCGF